MAVYVAPFYLIKSIRPSATLRRDDTSVILGRSRSVLLSTIICTITTYFLLTSNPSIGPSTALRYMGISLLNPTGAINTLALTMLLFAGPFFETLICHRKLLSLFRLSSYTTLWGDLTKYRNLVIGPLTEEFLFRSAALPFFILSQPQPLSSSTTSYKTLFLIPPVIFGLAHFHHVYEFRLTNPQAPLWHGLIRSGFQLVYTSLFGSFAAFCFLRTGSLSGVVLAHAFCNYMGLPRVWGRVAGPHIYEIEDSLVQKGVMGPETGKKSDDVLAYRGQKPLGVAWSVVYYVLLLAGAAGFYRYFWVLTEDENAMVQF